MLRAFFWLLQAIFLVNTAWSKVELRTQVGEEIRYLDPQRSTGISSAHISINLFTGLYEYDHRTGQPVPGLAKSYKVNSDFTEYTFALRNDYYWVQNVNGTIVKKRQVNAHDVVFSFRRILDPKLASEYAYMLYIIKNAQAYNEGKVNDASSIGVTALADDIVKITLSGPVPTLLNYLPHHSFHLVPPEPILAYGEDWVKPKHIWSSGPFAFEEWILKDRITIVKNPYFFDAANVQLDRVHFRFIGTYSPEAVRAFRSGEIDLDYQTPPANELRAFKRSGHLLISKQLGTYFYRINTTIKPLDDSRVRRALALTVPRKQIVKYIMKGGQTSAFSLIPDAFSGYTPSKFVEPMAMDLTARTAEARRLLVAAGYPNGDNMPLISLVYNTSETHKKIAIVVAKAWQKILGIKVRPLNEEWRVYLNNQKSLNYEIQRAGWVADMDDPMNFAELFISGGGNNNTGYTNSRFDQLIARARIEGDRKQRLKMLEQAEGILMEDLPIIPVFNYVSINLAREYVSGFYANKFDQHPLRFVRINEAERNANLNRTAKNGAAK